MIQTPLSSSSDKAAQEKILEFIKRRAPYSVLESGLNLASEGHILECSKSGSSIHGAVRDDSVSHSVTLRILSSIEADAECSCSSKEDIADQWCPHAVALFWRSHELSFFDTLSGFDASESTYRMNTSSPAEIAAIINEISAPGRITASESSFIPHVKILLDLSTDRLGVKVLFDDEIQTPTLFEGFRKLSNRALDSILLRILDDEGMWDEERSLWYVNSSKSIEIALGLVEEYKDIFSLDGTTPVTFSKDIINARLHVRWLESSAELEMVWVLPNGLLNHKEGDLLGTGPYWAVIKNTVYRISATASRIASIFPHSPSITLTRSQVGPILESLTSSLVDPTLIEIENPDLQPSTKVKQPTPTLHLEKKENVSEHFGTRKELEIQGVLEYNYPAAPTDKNIVYLPDREKEREYSDLLKSLGFEFNAARKSYLITGDHALELIHRGGGKEDSPIFPSPWKVHGLEAIRKSIKFVELSLNINLSSNRGEDGRTSKKGGPIDWFDCHVSLVQNNANVPISTLFKNGKVEGDRWIALDSGAYARVPGGSVHQLKTTLGMLDPNFKLSNSIKAKLTTAQAISLSRMGDDHFQVGLDQKLKDLSKKLDNFDAIDQIPVSKHFEGELRSYQREGLSWLNFLNDLDLGGILADEMGLGKTVQTLALLQHLKDSKIKGKTLNKPALVVAPTSVITNWLYEARRFAPKLKTLLLHGSGRRTSFASIPEHDIVITSYALLRMDRFELEKYDFSYVILDEAQNIKNPDAATTKAAKGMRAARRLALTGTPTENRPQELWSIMDFLMPGYLGSLEFFKTYIEKPILEAGPEVQVAKFLNSKTRPFILRRKKHDVEKDLPPKVESVLHVDMTDSQRQLYSAILEEVRPRIFDAIDKKGVKGASISILAALLRLRQVCNHPNSIDSLKAVGGYDSGKFNLMKELITEALENGRKILLFSQFREMLVIIRRWLAETGVEYLYLDGATKNRQDIVDKFNNDVQSRLFLISLKAGGTGLNLTAADTVVIYDPWWNPAVESQAVDRAHRIGQSKTVSVYRLVTENSVEQKIMELKAKKAKIVDALINNEDGLSVMKLSKTDLEQIFSPIPTT